MPSPTQSNRIKYGLSMLYYSPLTETDAGVITYADPVALPGAISISLPPQGERRYLSADNVVYFEAWSNGGYQGDLNLAMIPDHFRLACLGEKQDAAENSNVTYETSDLITQRFALLGQFDGDYKNIRFVLYNCTASRPQIASQTIDGESGLDPSQSTETLTISANPRRIDKIIRSKLIDDGSETFTNWFQGVYVPTPAAA